MRDLARFIEEDLGPRGDVTTRALFGNRARPARAVVVARERLWAAGLPEAMDVFARFGIRARAECLEAEWVSAGQTLLELRGPLQGILQAERLALNLLGRMSGIATRTRRLQARASRANPACRVAATRKTTPGFRAFEKRAVALGGGDPHRFGLYDGVLIKDNHLAALGSIRRAVHAARRARPRQSVEVEVSRLDHALAAAKAGADWLLLDNLSPTAAARIARAARRRYGHLRIESSGGITPATLAQYARFSDRVSLGQLTHSARSSDVSLELVSARTIKA